MRTVFLILFLLMPIVAHAADAEDKTMGQPLPRFASLRSDEVNMRTGPGTRYPIEWVYKRKGLPVEITGEFEIWRRVRDADGSEGWVQKSNLTGKRMAMVTGAYDLRDEASPQAPVVAHLEKDAQGQILSCTKDWCRLKFDDVKGYLPKNQLWGAYPTEVFD